jgi:hypothetical protein
MLPSEDKNPSKFRCRYEADVASLIRHTDIHMWRGNRRNLIAVIDDNSRRIMERKSIPDKNSLSAEFILDTIQTVNEPPFALWSENGREFQSHLTLQAGRAGWLAEPRLCGFGSLGLRGGAVWHVAGLESMCGAACSTPRFESPGARSGHELSRRGPAHDLPQYDLG